MSQLTLTCLINAAASLEYHKQPSIDGCYEIDGDIEDLKVILSDPQAAMLLRVAYPYGLKYGERIALMRIRFPEGLQS